MIIIPVYKGDKIDQQMAQQIQKFAEKSILLHNKNFIVRQGGQHELQNIYASQGKLSKIFDTKNTIRLEETFNIDDDENHDILSEGLFDRNKNPQDKIARQVEKNLKRELRKERNDEYDVLNRMKTNAKQQISNNHGQNAVEYEHLKDILKSYTQDVKDLDSVSGKIIKIDKEIQRLKIKVSGTGGKRPPTGPGEDILFKDMVKERERLDSRKNDLVNKIQSRKQMLDSNKDTMERLKNQYWTSKSNQAEMQQLLDYKKYKDLLDAEADKLNRDQLNATSKAMSTMQQLDMGLAKGLLGGAMTTIKGTSSLIKNIKDNIEQKKENEKLEKTFSFRNTDMNDTDEPTTIEVKNPKYGDFQISMKAIVIDGNISELKTMFEKDLRDTMASKIKLHVQNIIRKNNKIWAALTGLNKKTNEQSGYFLNSNYSQQIFDSTDFGYDFNINSITYNDVQNLQRHGWKYVFITDLPKNEIWCMVNYSAGKSYSIKISIDKLYKFYNYRTKTEITFEELSKEMQSLIKA